MTWTWWIWVAAGTIVGCVLGALFGFAAAWNAEARKFREIDAQLVAAMKDRGEAAEAYAFAAARLREHAAWIKSSEKKMRELLVEALRGTRVVEWGGQTFDVEVKVREPASQG